MNTPPFSVPLPPGMAAPPAPRAQIPGGFPVDTGHNAVFMLVQFYGQLLTEQAKRIDILAAHLGNEQRERLRLSQDNTTLRQKLSMQTFTPVESDQHVAQEDEERLAGDERGRDEGAEPA